MGNRGAIVDLFHRVGEEFGRLHVLVNSAARGLERPRSAIDSLPKHLQHTIDVNVFGPWFCAQEAAKLMTESGAIVNLLSPGSERYLPRYAPVAVSKGALASLTTYLAVELAPRGIRVNGVSAGLVEGSDGVRMLPPELLERYRGAVPAGRLVAPAEVAEAVAFLCSDAAAMVVGHVLLVDGGYSLLGLA
jgi:enoyl-[acyl-carrier protein] reductase III